MKLLILLAALSVPVTSFAESNFNYSEKCSFSCRMAIFGSLEEFAYHSGWSTRMITEALVSACSSEQGNPLTQGKCQIPEPTLEGDIVGTIHYAIQAECVFEEYKAACEL